ncbi:hypothetical protein SDC9_209390 [bioreactor metagenome]|uniref:Uncharacterized protein n=1 Tax=bioreactor metagenome TaxID=1076179 RepID=A0A645JEP6_9ZZZZ
MIMRIDDARNDGFSLHIDFFGIFSGIAQYLFVAPYLEYAIFMNDHRFGHLALVIESNHLGIVENFHSIFPP